MGQVAAVAGHWDLFGGKGLFELLCCNKNGILLSICVNSTLRMQAWSSRVWEGREGSTFVQNRPNMSMLGPRSTGDRGIEE